MATIHKPGSNADASVTTTNPLANRMKATEDFLASMDTVKSNLYKLFAIKTSKSKDKSSLKQVNESDSRVDWFQQIHGNTDSDMVKRNADGK